MTKPFLSVLSAVFIAAFSVSPIAHARDLIYGTFVSPKHGAIADGMVPYFKAIKSASDGEMNWQVDTGGSLATAKGTLTAIKNDLMNAGHVIPPYVPNLLPATNVVFDTFVFGGNIVAATGASLETALLHCPQCVAENHKENTVLIFGYSTAPYQLMCRRRIASVAELKGLKVRASAGGVRLMRLAGAVPVAMSPAAATTALQRGTLDCVDGPLEWIRAFGYGPTVKSILDDKLGMMGPVAVFQINRSTWKSFTPSQRRLYLKFAPAAVARIVFEYEYDETQQVLESERNRGVAIEKGGSGFKRLIAKFNKIQRTENVSIARRFGVRNPEAIMQAYDKALVKWDGLSKTIGHSTTRFAAALRREIYSKLDPNRM